MLDSSLFPATLCTQLHFASLGKKILQGDNTYFHQCVNYYLEHSLLTVFGGCLSLVKQNLTALGLSVCLCEVGGNAFVDIWADVGLAAIALFFWNLLPSAVCFQAADLWCRHNFARLLACDLFLVSKHQRMSQLFAFCCPRLFRRPIIGCLAGVFLT